MPTGNEPMLNAHEPSQENSKTYISINPLNFLPIIAATFKRTKNQPPKKFNRKNNKNQNTSFLPEL